jgi:hypothetical protein
LLLALTPASDNDFAVQTTFSVAAIKKSFSEFRAGADIKNKRIEIYSKYPNADETSFNHNNFYVICTSVRNDNTSSEREKRDELSNWETNRGVKKL